VDIDEQMSFGLLKKMRGNDVEALGNWYVQWKFSLIW
jgi:hypothetical protein